MFNIVLAISYFLSGFFMKLSDDYYDEKSDARKAIFLGIVCGLFTALACSIDLDAACIFIAILIGNILALKVDGIHHVVTLVIFVLICLVCGIPHLSLVVLMICIISALADEIGHELISKITDNQFLNLFFEYRFVMKIVILLLAVCGVFSIWIFVCFISFEIAYETAGIVFEKLN